MTLFTRRAFISISVGTVLAGFNPEPANAQISRIRGLIPAVIKFKDWAWPYLKEALLQEIANQAAHYIVEHAREIVQVTVNLTREGIERINAALRDETNSHLLEIASAAVAAGVVFTIAVSGPGSLFTVPMELVAEAATLPLLLVFYHDDVSNFIAGQAYEVIASSY
ncbi:hypothetical protein DSM106972_096670 [Dulcicalothrix desertica PCC 7102]|uniref:Uncharacterized protein n=1 Tax=Dulcicalothrix desertica PCC 7102 TaxID=232991 RepID=A0A3S1I7P2_9CYAN|nr:hypothetical protein [Dulcicalothrix desertica]RUS93311.1 hypothetical protein DSM106972_096670 [Dulcicalothrix desertica PCC 7102]TWH62770.1 hypothetical protein CAL7102_00293 [Dulcicalothrix desertica PCC 7102]